MKAVVQRVERASVRVGGEPVAAPAAAPVASPIASPIASIGPGMLIFVGVMRGDGEKEARKLAERLARFRFFADEDGRMNRSALDGGFPALVVSQFTLAADGRAGRRPSFDAAAPPEIAEPLYEVFVEALRGVGLRVATGRFGARMQVDLVNDGPVTFSLEQRPEAGGG